MRILLASYWFLLHAAGGAYSSINILKKELEEHGHQVDVLSSQSNMQKINIIGYERKNEYVWGLGGKEVNKQIIKDVVYEEVYDYYTEHLPHVEPSIRWREIERYSFELAVSLFDLNKYDIIHAHDIVAARALRRVKPSHIPLVYTCHDVVARTQETSGEITGRKSDRWKYAIAEQQCAVESSDASIVPSKRQLLELMRHCGVSGETFHVVPYGMELAPFIKQLQYEPYPPVYKDPEKLVIACVARLVPEKGHKTLIDALHILKGIHSGFVCWFIGDGWFWGELDQYARTKGVADHIVFLGNRWDVPHLLNKIDMMVMPSINGNLSFAIMEAQFAGVPVIVSDGGANTEMVQHGETGIVFQRRNASQLATKLLMLMSDPQLRRELGEKAKIWGEKMWSTGSLYERTMTVYKQALESAKPERPMTADTDLAVRYGLTEQTGLQKQCPSTMFAFHVDRNLDSELWKSIAERLPPSYSIPDIPFIKALAEDKEN
ncbi:glycosyltransferase family 4 protein [Paenibacillus alkalitolerans]|uniref:glycosyltransferase family 4 protein n=1 Tax=Paenibacillus alkalitolerans TaxID=2799335 RepID=UPI0018F42C54|nr:glycosyltransferase family 4 protein [Paenibacillus alkalitolerans]